MSDGNASSADFSWPFIEKLEVTRWAVFTLWVVLVVLGLPGNLLIISVCRAKRIRTTTHVFIGALAMADLLTCVLKFADAIILASASQYLEYDNQHVVYFLSTGLLYTTAFLTTFIAFDRFDAVCRSLRRTMTLRRAKIAAGGCYAAGFIGVLPEAGHKIHLALHDEEVDTFIRSVFKFIPIALYIASLLVVTVLYCVIFVFVRKRREVLPVDMLTGQHCSVSTIGNVNYQKDCSSSRDHQENKSQIATVVGSTRVIQSRNQQATVASSASAGQSHTPSSTRAYQLHSQIPSVNSPDTSRLENQPATALRPNRPCEGTAPGPYLQSQVRRPRQTNVSQSRMTKMLLIATFMLFILWFPNVYIKSYALGGLFVDFLKSSYHANVVAALLVLKDVVYFNSVLNAFIYGIANKRFRQDCRMVIHRLRQRFQY